MRSHCRARLACPAMLQASCAGWRCRASVSVRAPVQRLQQLGALAGPVACACACTCLFGFVLACMPHAPVALPAGTPLIVMAKGPGVQFTGGGPLALWPPDLPGYTALRGRALYVAGRYACEGSLRWVGQGTAAWREGWFWGTSSLLPDCSSSLYLHNRRCCPPLNQPSAGPGSATLRLRWMSLRPSAWTMRSARPWQ